MTKRAAVEWIVAVAGAVLVALPASGSRLRAQELLDRVMARVGSEAVTLSDVQAAVALGIVEVDDPSAVDDEALQRVIDRRLALSEVNRIPRTEPEPDAVAAEVARMKAHAGPRLDQVLASTGTPESRLPDIARDTLRIRAYLVNRFPTVPVSDADAEQYFKANPDRFRRDGAPQTFDEAAPAVRAALATERRSLRIAQWLNNLRERTDVSLPR